MKIIVDGSYRKPNTGIIAMFIVGERVWHEKISCESSTEAELLAIKMALEHLQKNKLKGVVVISDCQSVVETINKQVKGKKIYQLYGPVIIEIQKLLKQTNSTLLWNPRKESLVPDIACHNEQSGQYKTISLPKLDKFNPTIESTCIKLSEEVGELSRLVGRMRGLSGEKHKVSQQTYDNVGKELLDVAQTAITMMFVLEDQHKVKIGPLIKQHHNKLKTKNYMS